MGPFLELLKDLPEDQAPIVTVAILLFFFAQRNTRGFLAMIVDRLFLSFFELIRLMRAVSVVAVLLLVIVIKLLDLFSGTNDDDDSQ